MITGSEALWLSLIEEGVDTVFGYPGGQIMPVYDTTACAVIRTASAISWCGTNREPSTRPRAMPA